MADYDYKEYNSTRINYKKNRKTTIKRSVAKVGNKSYERVEIREGRNSYKGLIGGLLGLSTLLLFGSYFFIGGFNSQIIKTEVNETVVNEINGVEYVYDVNYVDYDYTYKLIQLSNLRNVFTLDSFNSLDEKEAFLGQLRIPNPEYFSSDGIYSDDSSAVNIMLNNVYTIIMDDTYTFNDITYSYYYFGPLNYGSIPKGQEDYYRSIYDKYLNYKNADAWVRYQKQLLQEGDNLYDDIVYAFKVINAPIIWVGNLIYDLGVIVNFLVNW